LYRLSIKPIILIPNSIFLKIALSIKTKRGQ
jgi:hypothetical protein